MEEKIKNFCKTFINEYYDENTDAKVSYEDGELSVGLIDTNTNEMFFSFDIDINSIDFDKTHIDGMLFGFAFGVWEIFVQEY